jgi:hypothetical protein
MGAQINPLLLNRFPPKPEGEEAVAANIRTLYMHRTRANPRAQSYTAVTRGFEDYAYDKIVRARKRRRRQGNGGTGTRRGRRWTGRRRVAALYRRGCAFC